MFNFSEMSDIAKICILLAAVLAVLLIVLIVVTIRVLRKPDDEEYVEKRYGEKADSELDERTKKSQEGVDQLIKDLELSNPVESSLEEKESKEEESEEKENAFSAESDDDTDEEFDEEDDEESDDEESDDEMSDVPTGNTTRLNVEAVEAALQDSDTEDDEEEEIFESAFGPEVLAREKEEKERKLDTVFDSAFATAKSAFDDTVEAQESQTVEADDEDSEENTEGKTNELKSDDETVEQDPDEADDEDEAEDVAKADDEDEAEDVAEAAEADEAEDVVEADDEDEAEDVVEADDEDEAAAEEDDEEDSADDEEGAEADSENLKDEQVSSGANKDDDDDDDGDDDSTIEDEQPKKRSGFFIRRKVEEVPITVNPANSVNITTVNAESTVDTKNASAGIGSMSEMKDFLTENPVPKKKKKKISKKEKLYEDKFGLEELIKGDQYFWYNSQDIEGLYKKEDMYFHCHYFKSAEEVIDMLIIEMYDCGFVRTEEIQRIAFGVEFKSMNLQDILRSKENVSFNASEVTKEPSEQDAKLIYEKWCDYVDNFMNIIVINAPDEVKQEILTALYRYGHNDADVLIYSPE